MTCPKCKAKNVDNWPLEINGKIIWGGCQDCWEAECDCKYWEIIGGEYEQKT